MIGGGDAHAERLSTRFRKMTPSRPRALRAAWPDYLITNRLSILPVAFRAGGIPST
jgi:hypothetical protein